MVLPLSIRTRLVAGSSRRTPSLGPLACIGGRGSGAARFAPMTARSADSSSETADANAPTQLARALALDLQMMPTRSSNPNTNGMDPVSRWFDVTNLGKWLNIPEAPKSR